MIKFVYAYTLLFYCKWVIKIQIIALQLIIYALAVLDKNKVPSLSINQNMVVSKCECGHNGKESLKVYIKNYYNNQNKKCSYISKCHGQPIKYYCKTCNISHCSQCKPQIGRHTVYTIEKLPVAEIRRKLQQGEEHLNNYFKQLKESSIQKSPNQKIKIEIAYKNALILIQMYYPLRIL